MARRRPFATPADLIEAADELWSGLGRDDRLEAFAAHPRIGDLSALRARFSGPANEQAEVAGAADEVIEALAEGNRRYEDRYAHIFIVCATGKSADTMLGLLRARLDNDPEAELANASAEQAKITRIRLARLWS